MQFSYSLVLFAAVVFTTFCIQGITGFGSTILALPFVIYLVDDPHVVIPTLTILSLIFCSVLLIKDYRNIAWRKMGNMLIYMVIGGPFGVLLFKSITREVFLPFLGCIIIIIAVWGLLRIKVERFAVIKLSPWLGKLLLFTGGAVQGAFASGGPFVMPYAEEVFKDKSEFRTSLQALWLFSNIIVTMQYFMAGIDITRVFYLSAVSTPAVLLGLALSLKLHQKLNLRTFLLLLYFFLLLAGLFTLASVF